MCTAFSYGQSLKCLQYCWVRSSERLVRTSPISWTSFTVLPTTTSTRFIVLVAKHSVSALS